MKKNEHVAWNTTRGETTGHVKKQVTHDIKIKGNTVKASGDHPKIVVKSDKTGAEAAHKPESLKKR
ncbi:hypothetical protein AA106555_0418 [Neokomagataea thailandica NBRC 106555]|uniref:DUF2945 domain-containing protein n=2 Tax=Neokomagataea TaxID=1223423 RepID=A0A4Y6V7R4_9PROT|nr:MULTISPECIES: DUF2945 domain-containing protein [Neokomagataea]QDH26099.1 DUF2945 domain-containing protein [Neokomagataea tanensis]GBR51039.1 hypothetical protein AA106555_0418 [Neokomagataea thailandica NBRC 106555]